MITTAAPLAVIASSDADYARLGLARKDIKAWEDGARTDDRPGSYEWWYFDAHLEDGTKLVVVFMDKDLATPQKPLEPTIRLSLDLADGRSFEKLVTFEPAVWASATDHCDVRIGENRFTGDLHTYRITATVDDVAVDVTLEGEVPPWRPETGQMLFGEDRKREFSWLPSVLRGKVTAKYSIGDERHEATGTGYHDHNWGNVGLMEIVHDWYWGRGQAGPYSVIASYITAHEKYDYAAIPIFMLARDGVLIGDDPSRLTFEMLGTFTDSVTRKPVANVTRYTYGTDEERYVVTFTRHRDLSRSRMIEDLHGVKRVVAALLHFDGAYLRFSGEVRVEHYQGAAIVDQYVTEDAIWELMYFGHARV
ncbi:MAG: hydroxyneurosporene dehydrogenase [Acidobacteriota bacterium]|nr:hydroxyneurosporene dehydrogenase [Acidobacteriota bacterium]